MTRLKETYLNEIVDAMTKKFGYKNVMQVPKLICSLLQEAHYMIFRTFYGIIIAYFYKNFILSIAFHKIVRFSHDLVRRLF